MRTLSEIVDAVKDNEPTTHEECKYALVALTNLATFDQMDLQKLASNEQDGKKSLLTPWHYYEESFNRWKAAWAKSPKEWLGWNNDPENPEFRDRRNVGKKIFEAALKNARK